MSEDTSRVCGYCYTNDHERCRPEIKWYDKVWYCYCETCNKQEKEDTPQNEETISPVQDPVFEQPEEPTASSPEPGTDREDQGELS